MTTKFTPGPWDGVLPCGGVIKKAVKYPLKVSDERLDGESWLDMRERTESLRHARAHESEANIALQKAAPDLYDALEEADKTLCILQSNVAHANKTSSKWDGIWQEIEKIRQQNQLVLAKARGEQP